MLSGHSQIERDKKRKMEDIGDNNKWKRVVIEEIIEDEALKIMSNYNTSRAQVNQVHNGGIPNYNRQDCITKMGSQGLILTKR